MKKLSYLVVVSMLMVGLVSCGESEKSGENNLSKSDNVNNVKSDQENNQSGSGKASNLNNNNKNMESNLINDGNVVVITLASGEVEVQIDPVNAPKTTANFKKLVNEKFYDGLVYHRVIPGFVAQGGDPKGDGTGGSDVNVPLEIMCADGTMVEGEETNCTPMLKHDKGVIAMARTMDPNSATSQFYITLDPQPSLDGKYAVFGKVIKGIELVEQIQQGDMIMSIKIKN